MTLMREKNTKRDIQPKPKGNGSWWANVPREQWTETLKVEQGRMTQTSTDTLEKQREIAGKL
jgi:hypothetical protein